MNTFQYKIGVIIATSLNRIDKLLTRSLLSVANQTRKPDYILIVDDNVEASVRIENKTKIQRFGKENNLSQLFYIENNRTKGMSGTGAWNTGFDWYNKHFSREDYIAILDDDDMWESTYIEECEKKILEAKIFPDQVIAFLKRSDCSKAHRFNLEDLKIDNFLIGNPGVQGSNMFFKLNSVLKIGGFDETLPSCADRDFMIRFLNQKKKPVISIVNKILVNHFAEFGTITYDPIKKEKGLDAFYKKFIHIYSQKIILRSLERSKKLFSYQNADNIHNFYKLVHFQQAEEKIVIGIALHNNSSTIRLALESVLNQKNLKTKVYVLIVDDSSVDNWKNQIENFLQQDNVLYWKVNFCNVSKTRNFINQFIKKYFRNVKLIGRLDSDDIYSSDTVLSKIEEIKDLNNADVIFAGNYLKMNGKLLDRINRANEKLKNHQYLLELLEKMAAGTAENELPSCNTFMTLKSLKEYPDVPSAEDHFVTARLLWNKDDYKLSFAEDVLLTVYNINGKLTDDNKKKNTYLDARKKLLEEIKSYE